jgi:hypothetical protein
VSNYTQITFFAPKDALLSGNPAKLIKGADVDPELAAIAVAIASKYDATNFAFANPSAAIGLAAVNGTATTPMRSDAAPALSQAISPTWTGNHTFSNAITVNGAGTSLKGGVTVNAPSSGIAFTANNVVGSPVAHFTSVNTTTSDVEIYRSTSTANTLAAGPNLNLQDSGAVTATILQHAGGQSELWQFNSAWHQIWKVNANGALGVNAPFGFDVALTVTGLANRRTQLIQASSTSGQSFGLLVSGGTTSADSGLEVTNSAASQTFFKVRGDGIVQAVDQSNTLQDVGWRGTPVNLQSGNYTLVLADRGRLVGETTAGNTITVPANVFSAGDVVTIGAGITSGSITVAQGASLVMNWANGSNTTGNRTLTGVGIATVIFINSTSCWITGSALS